MKKEIDNELNHFLGNIYYQISKVGYDNHNLHEHMNFIRAKKELSNVLTLERLDEKLNEFYKKAIQ